MKSTKKQADTVSLLSDELDLLNCEEDNGTPSFRSNALIHASSDGEQQRHSSNILDLTQPLSKVNYLRTVLRIRSAESTSLRDDRVS